jgi:ATP synthase protein I
MQPASSHSGDLSHEAASGPAHRTRVTPAADAADADAAAPSALRGKRFYSALSASSVGLELGLSVVISVLFGMWLDGKLGTAPWLMLAWLGVGLAAGFRGVLRAVRRADREADREAARG